jgi:FkbM family methyltransferase
MIRSVFGTSKINKQNLLSVYKSWSFRRQLSVGKCQRREFQNLKHRYPYFGFVPCHSHGVDFILFHCNDDVVAWNYFWLGANKYEPTVTHTWIKWCEEADIVYDIGAYTGLMTILACLINSKTKVHLFEPMERTIERAKINCCANCIHGRVNYHNKALSNKKGQETIHLYRDENFLGTGNAIDAKVGLEVIGTKIIETVVGDDYLCQESPSIIKIDVEGHELEVLKGLEKTIARCRPKIIVEVWQKNRVDILSFFDALGYICHPFDDPQLNVVDYRCIPKTMDPRR